MPTKLKDKSAGDGKLSDLLLFSHASATQVISIRLSVRLPVCTHLSFHNVVKGAGSRRFLSRKTPERLEKISLLPS